ncbi:hypothetical protein JOM56_001790 [Amanita muscaria]
MMKEALQVEVGSISAVNQHRYHPGQMQDNMQKTSDLRHQGRASGRQGTTASSSSNSKRHSERQAITGGSSRTSLPEALEIHDEQQAARPKAVWVAFLRGAAGLSNEQLRHGTLPEPILTLLSHSPDIRSLGYLIKDQTFMAETPKWAKETSGVLVSLILTTV